MPSRLPFSLVVSFFNETQKSTLLKQVQQFENLVTLLQYRKPYGITQEFVKPGEKVLDWGCGNGHFSYYLTQKKIDTIGYSFDTTPKFLENEPLFRFAQGNTSEPTKLPFPDSTFDTVFSMGVLEHVYETGGNEVNSLQEINRILKREGRFICFHFPNKLQWVEPFGKLLGLAEHFHYRKYTGKNIHELSVKAGFEIEHLGRYNFFPRNFFRFFPNWVKQSLFFIQCFEFVDWLFSRLFPWFCTNWYFIAKVKK